MKWVAKARDNGGGGTKGQVGAARQKGCRRGGGVGREGTFERCDISPVVRAPSIPRLAKR